MTGKALKTKAYIVEKTAALFNKKGFSGTSLLDLTEATGLTKGALYGNFDNKERIAEAVFSYSMQKVKRVAREVVGKKKTNKAKLEALFRFYSQYVLTSPVPGGCPMMNYAVEADDHQVFMKKSVSREINDTINFITELLENGRRSGEFNLDLSAREMANTFFCAIEGAIVISRVTSSKAPMKAVLDHCNDILNQISL